MAEYGYLDLRYGVSIWHLAGVGTSLIAFAAVLLVDREYGHGLALHHIPEMAVIFFVGALTGGAFVTWETLELVPPLVLLFVVVMYAALKMNKKPVVWRVLLGFVLLCILFFVAGIVLGLHYTIWSLVP